MSFVRLSLGFLLAFALGCPSSHPRPLDDSGPGDGDEPECPEIVHPIPLPTQQVDILFVIDNSVSMDEEQAHLARSMQEALQYLVNPPDDAPHLPPAIKDIHVGVISTDIGTSGYEGFSCPNPGQGDNGVLQSHGDLDLCPFSFNAPDCSHGDCPWLAHTPTYPDVGDDVADAPIWEDFACLATLGTAGCGIEQPLEASYIALVEQTRPGMPNEEFLREDAPLYIIYVTDEDDCSVANPELLDIRRTEFGPISSRCAMNEDQLHPISRYTDAFIALKNGRENLVHVLTIAGFPIDGTWNPGDPVERLRDLRGSDTPGGGEIPASCDSSIGRAYHTPRLAELAYSFGDHGRLLSICGYEGEDIYMTIARNIVDTFLGCVEDDPELPINSMLCHLVEVLPDDRRCPNEYDGLSQPLEISEGWQLDLGLDEDGQRLCGIVRADLDVDGCPVGAADCANGDFTGGSFGWFYDTNFTGCTSGELRFTHDEISVAGGYFELQCCDTAP